MKNITIKELDATTCRLILQNIRREDPNYLAYFTPFNWNTNDFFDNVMSSIKDQYFGIFIDEMPIGFYMLRGFDQGFKIPSYGIWISSKYSNLGFAQLALNHAHCFCKLNKVQSIILKVHSENTFAKLIYEKHGYVFSHNDNGSGQLVYYHHFNK